jgi:hypothetical protein
MRRWVLVLFALVGISAAAACGSQSAAVSSPSSTATMTGNWAGTASDSSGSMMGSGMSGASTGSTTWQVTQNGSAFSGTMHLPGYGGNAIMVSGIMNGTTGSFTMTMPAGSMGSMMSGTCTSTAAGTFDMDDMMTQFHGTYNGTNTCGGPFNGGQMLMVHR